MDEREEELQKVFTTSGLPGAVSKWGRGNCSVSSPETSGIPCSILMEYKLDEAGFEGQFQAEPVDVFYRTQLIKPVFGRIEEKIPDSVNFSFRNILYGKFIAFETGSILIPIKFKKNL